MVGEWEEWGNCHIGFCILIFLKSFYIIVLSFYPDYINLLYFITLFNHGQFVGF